MIPYRDLQPARRFPVITILLIAANLAAFAYLFWMPEEAGVTFVYRYAVLPLEFKLGRNLAISPGIPPFLSVFTAMFLHGGWLHLFGNMLYLWIFGNNVEGSMGHFRFLIFYLLCGVIATFAQIYGTYDSKIPALGASGAIAGVLAAYLRLFPRAKIAVLIPIFIFFRSVILPAWVVLGFWTLIQFLEVRAAGNQAQGGVAYLAHIGGFIAGFLLMPAFLPRRRR